MSQLTVQLLRKHPPRLRPAVGPRGSPQSRIDWSRPTGPLLSATSAIRWPKSSTSFFPPARPTPNTAERTENYGANSRVLPTWRRRRSMKSFSAFGGEGWRTSVRGKCGASRKILADLGSRPKARLKAMPAPEVYRFLTGLPGMGPKSALCVMMYSLNFDVFPVDVNVQRWRSASGPSRPDSSIIGRSSAFPPSFRTGGARNSTSVW